MNLQKPNEKKVNFTIRMTYAEKKIICICIDN